MAGRGHRRVGPLQALGQLATGDAKGAAKSLALAYFAGPLAILLAAVFIVGAVGLLIIGSAGSANASSGVCAPAVDGPPGSATSTLPPVAGANIPPVDIPLFQAAAVQYGLGRHGAATLAAINDIESTFDKSTARGIHSGTDGQLAGPMQLPVGGDAGFADIGVNAPGDPPKQRPDIHNEADAIFSAAHYLSTVGFSDDSTTWRPALLSYSQSDQLVDRIISASTEYYNQGVAANPAPGATSGPAPAAPGSSSGAVNVPPAANDPAGRQALQVGRPTFVAATFYGGPSDGTSGTRGAWGDDLNGKMAFAELSPGVPGSQVTRANADMLGGLPHGAALKVVNPATGASVVAYKLDIGAGQPLSSTLHGYHYRIDLWYQLAQRLGITGSQVVQVTLLKGVPNASGPPPPCAGQPTAVTPGDHAQLRPDGTATVPADAPPAVKRAIIAANQIHTKPYPHPDVHYGSLAKSWPAYDCSGAVSYVLYKAGLHSATPDVSGTLASWGAPKAGKWISVYANKGHTWIVIAGLAFDTADFGGPNTPGGTGPRWRKNPTGNLADGLAYTVRHPAGL